jgi:hypothetical protein
MDGGVDYFRYSASAKHDLYEGDQEVHRSGYLTDLLSDRAVSFVREQRGRPFLLSLPSSCGYSLNKQFSLRLIGRRLIMCTQP